MRTVRVVGFLVLVALFQASEFLTRGERNPREPEERESRIWFCKEQDCTEYKYQRKGRCEKHGLPFEVPGIVRT